VLEWVATDPDGLARLRAARADARARAWQAAGRPDGELGDLSYDPVMSLTPIEEHH